MTPAPRSPRHRRLWLLVSAAWSAPAVFGALNEVAQHRLHGEAQLELGSILFGAGDWLIYAAFTPAVLMAAQRWPLSRPRLRLHGGLHLALALVFAAAVTARDRETQLAQLSEQLAAARLAALEARVNPHFLFNTLNTIAVLVRGDEPGAAGRLVEQLSDVLRRSLGRHREHEVTLADELDLVGAYVAIEQARFPDRLRVRVDVPDTLLGAALPGFALQHLVENAVRHGVARSAAGGEVTVAAHRRGDRLELTVSDDGAGLAADADRPGHGMAATRERLRALYGERASLTVEPRAPRGVTATLRLPWRELEGDGAAG